MGSIVTFYSFKGGVGRTMALANIAVCLAQMGEKVLMVDWDLEAPGLPRYFDDYSKHGNSDSGLLDLLSEAKNIESPSALKWRNYVSSIHLEQGQSIDLISSGTADKDYAGKVLDFEWDTFFQDFNGGEIIEHLRDEWRTQYDFVLIDSRTGITDSGGICTIQLPDILAVVFTANSQSLYGVKDIVVKAQQARQYLAFDRSPFLVLPIPSRFDGRTEYEESQKWLNKFSEELKAFYSDWISKETSPLEIIEKNKLPYVGFFSFGEKLPVVLEGTSDPESLGHAYWVNANLYLAPFLISLVRP